MARRWNSVSKPAVTQIYLSRTNNRSPSSSPSQSPMGGYRGNEGARASPSRWIRRRTVQERLAPNDSIGNERRPVCLGKDSLHSSPRRRQRNRSLGGGPSCGQSDAQGWPCVQHQRAIEKRNCSHFKRKFRVP